jgi:tellurite resistance protein TerA
MPALTRGQNSPLTESVATVSITGLTPGAVDLFALQLTANGRVRSDADLVFFNNPNSPEGSVRLTGTDAAAVDLTRIPTAITSIRFAVAMDSDNPGALAAIGGLSARVGSDDCPASGLTTERAAVLAEIYRRGDGWKLRNVSAGWDAGLAALLTEHGVTVDESPTVPSQTVPSPAVPAPPAPRQAQPARPAPSVNLTKITLTKNTPTVSLAKTADRPSRPMRVNLNWTQGKRGLFGGGGVDLDLACLYQLRNGEKGVVQALGNAFGHLEAAPYIRLDADDRSGSAQGGENLHINLAHLDEFKRILIFAYIYQGVPNWAAADAVVTLFPPGGPEVQVRLDNPDRRARSCAIALLKNEKGELTVTREVQYINGSQAEVSKAYRWGLKWAAGRK